MSKIYIDPGHGGSDPGAVKYVKERTVAVKVADYMKQYLAANYIVDLKVSEGTQSTHERSAAANKWGADLFVSIHFNAGGGDGYENYLFSKKNKALGEMFWRYVKTTGQNAHGTPVKYEPKLNVLRLTNMPAILNEIAFVDNKKDIEDWNDNSELKEMGIALAKAAADYLNLSKKTVMASAEKPATAVKPSAEKPATAVKNVNYKVKIKVAALNVRQGAGTSYRVNRVIKDKGIYTIIQEKSGWGRLKSGAGWINISSNYVKKL